MRPIRSRQFRKLRRRTFGSIWPGRSAKEALVRREKRAGACSASGSPGAGECVVDAQRLESKDPELLAAEITLVAYQNWPAEKIDSLVDDVWKLDPHYYPCYLARAATLSSAPRRKAGRYRPIRFGDPKTLGRP